MLMLPRGPGPRELSPGLDHPPPDPTRSVSSLGSGAEAFPRGLLSTLAGRLLAGDQGPRVPFAHVVVCSLGSSVVSGGVQPRLCSARTALCLSWWGQACCGPHARWPAVARAGGPEGGWGQGCARLCLCVVTGSRVFGPYPASRRFRCEPSRFSGQSSGTAGQSLGALGGAGGVSTPLAGEPVRGGLVSIWRECARESPACPGSVRAPGGQLGGCGNGPDRIPLAASEL